MTRYIRLFMVLAITVSTCVGCYESYSRESVKFTGSTGRDPWATTSLQTTTTDKAYEATEDTTTLEIDEASQLSRLEAVELLAQQMIDYKPEVFGVWEGQPIEYAFELYDGDFVNVLADYYHIVDEVSGEIIGNIAISREHNTLVTLSMYTSVYDDPDSIHHRRSGDKVSVYHN